ncbi:MAG: cell wall hydrolase [Parasphingorhabdus sp.]|uniref:cell wall hydrolase n=1 Tax=Parasphingorhabdus sp. TaxID=2709688 RepID=UPI0030022FC5
MTWKGRNIGSRLTIVAGMTLSAAAAAAFWFFAQPSSLNTARIDLPPSDVNGEKLAPPKPELQLYKPITSEQAAEENEQLPFSTAPIERALPLILPSSQLLPIGRRNAIDCLSSAIYYEAGNEIDQGKRGVAQVILNRVRHPAYPSSICGVVYQGSERRTGCQFTFTCDGSLARRPVRDRWNKARIIAIGAISGFVEPTVGMSTHYHANYVLPYWAPSLDKTIKIGSHIFYRWKGSWGRRRAFVQAVQLDDGEPFAALTDETVADPDDQIDELNLLIIPPSRITADDTIAAIPRTQPRPDIVSRISPEILADQTRSTLTADEQKPILKADKQL